MIKALIGIIVTIGLLVLVVKRYRTTHSKLDLFLSVIVAFMVLAAIVIAVSNFVLM